MDIVIWLSVFIAVFLLVLAFIAAQPSPASDYLRYVILVAFVIALIAMVLVGGVWDLLTAAAGRIAS